MKYSIVIPFSSPRDMQDCFEKCLNSWKNKEVLFISERILKDLNLNSGEMKRHIEILHANRVEWRYQSRNIDAEIENGSFCAVVYFDDDDMKENLEKVRDTRKLIQNLGTWSLFALRDVDSGQLKKHCLAEWIVVKDLFENG